MAAVDEAEPRCALYAMCALARAGPGAPAGRSEPRAAKSAGGSGGGGGSARKPGKPKKIKNSGTLAAATAARTLRVLPGRPTREIEDLVQRWKPQVEQDAEWVASRLAGVGGLREAAVLCLREGNPRRKAALSLHAGACFADGRLAIEPGGPGEPPDEPARTVQTVAPKDVPKRGKGGSAQNRVKLVHSLAHIESVAIDLAWDMVARFGYDAAGLAVFPAAFFEDWVQVAIDEAIHHLMWAGRLVELGSFYGELPTHSGLWDSARKTSGLAEERLAIEHMVLEARGLDVAPGTFKKFVDCGDLESADMLEAIYSEEIIHVANGVTWFQYAASEAGTAGTGGQTTAVDKFHEIVRAKLTGKIKPPFNHEARRLAGMDEAYYSLS